MEPRGWEADGEVSEFSSILAWHLPRVIPRVYSHLPCLGLYLECLMTCRAYSRVRQYPGSLLGNLDPAFKSLLVS